MSEILLILLPGAMYFWILFIGQGPMQEILEEAESQILPRLLAGPVTPRQYVAAKMVRCYLLCSLSILLLLLAGSLLFGISWGNPLALMGVVALWAWSMTGLVAFIFSIVRTRDQANVFSPLVLLVLALLGGSMFPYENLPGFLQTLGQYTPNRWAVLTLSGVARSKPLAELVAPIVGLVAVGGLGSVLAFVLFGRRLTSGGRG